MRTPEFSLGLQKSVLARDKPQTPRLQKIIGFPTLVIQAAENGRSFACLMRLMQSRSSNAKRRGSPCSKVKGRAAFGASCLNRVRMGAGELLSKTLLHLLITISETAVARQEIIALTNNATGLHHVALVKMRIHCTMQNDWRTWCKLMQRVKIMLHVKTCATTLGCRVGFV
jgi:hypothetical protein